MRSKNNHSKVSKLAVKALLGGAMAAYLVYLAYQFVLTAQRF